MAMSDRRDYIALEWLSDEVVATVLNCASTIQSRPDAGTDPETLEVLAGQLHQARGSLQMIEFSGAGHIKTGLQWFHAFRQLRQHTEEAGVIQL